MRRWILLLFLASPALGAAPRIEFKETRYDFGLLVQGTTVQHSFDFTNTGRKPLEIQSVNTSCGCTAALSSDKVVPPGGRGRIDVTYDSRGKLGDVDKKVRVWTDDPENPLVVLSLDGTVVPSEHPDMTGAQNLFQGTCKTCHGDPAAGKKGRDLYNAACAMCHERGRRDGKKIAPYPEELAGRRPKELERIISRGLGTASMPAFAEKAGGPLSKKQVKSLVEYIRSLGEVK